MKRLHVHVAVPDLEQSIRFYSTLFNAKPTKIEHDYAKWMLDDPRVNFAISQRESRNPGVDHIGIQVDTRSELDELSTRLKTAGETTFDQEATNCCYAKSDKSWINDPSGVRWETFYTFGDATTYGEDPALAPTSACGPTSCAAEPAQQPAASCCS